MKKDWTIKKLGEVCEKIVDGSHNPPKGCDNSNYKMLSSKNIFNDEINFYEPRFLTQQQFESENKRTNIAKGDVLVTIVGTIGRCCVYPFDETVVFQRSVCVLKPKKDLIDSRYLMFSIISINLEKYGQGTAQKGIYLKQLSNIEILIPPLEEQKRIVAVLDKKFAQIETLKTAAEKNLQNAKQLFQAELEKAFSNTSWEKKTIQEICTLKSGNSSTNNSKPGTLPYVKVGDMTIVGNEKSITTSTTFVDYKSNKKQVFPIGSVIFPKRGGAILTNKKRITAVEICCDLNIMGVIPGEKICPNFLYYYFIGIDFSKLCNGAAIPQINNIDINPLEINLPPLEEQKRIVAHLDSLSEKVHQLEEIYTKQLADCDELKQSLLQKAFEGEL